MGSNVGGSDIEVSDLHKPGRTLLRHLAHAEMMQGVHPTPFSSLLADPTITQVTLEKLVRRKLLEQTNGVYRFQVEAIRCWFADYATQSI